MASPSLNDCEDGSYDSNTASREMKTLRISESNHQRSDSLGSNDGIPPTETTPLVRLDKRQSLETEGEKKGRSLTLQ